jgi:eukaryotic-like serine/threonine-protein kinase
MVHPAIGRYQLICELGQGSMGTLYLGKAEGVGGFARFMAIKIVHPHVTKQKQFIETFLEEARFAARVRHPNLVPACEIGEQDGRYFVAMDYVSGEPLSVFLDSIWSEDVPAKSDLFVHIVSIVCEALHAGHELRDPHGQPLGLVHRDVRPQNILVGYDGVVRVTDFGFAETIRLSSTGPAARPRPTTYSSPEELRGETVDRRSDIFSLGLVLQEATTGKRARSPHSAELEAIVLEAIDPEPEHRYATARQMGLALSQYLARRASLISSSDVERALKDSCHARYEERLAMEHRAATGAMPTPSTNGDSFQLSSWKPLSFDLVESAPSDRSDAVELASEDEDPAPPSNMLMELVAEELGPGAPIELPDPPPQ